MKMKLGITWCYLLFMLINHNKNSYYANAKSVDVGTKQNCQEHVGEFFKSFLNISIVPTEKNGGICGGHCCSTQTETDVLKKSVKAFEGQIRHQLKSLKGLWESTHTIYKDHVLDLSRQSENKTLILFSTVYRRMSPLSRTPILELYKSIRSYITSSQKSHELVSGGSNSNSNDELEAVIEKFFRNLFPLAYHHAVHNGEEDSSQATRDFHIDYKNCLTNSYEALQPFGDIPNSISRSLVQSVTSAATLLRALERGAEILNEIGNLPIENLSEKCQHALLKTNYCAACKGHNYHHLKTCYGYCSNVVRGCLSQLMGGIDTDWASFSEAIERLMTFVRNKDGIESIIKSLDGKLSEAIMHAMTNGPELQKKVHKSCGQPSIRLNEKLPLAQSEQQHDNDYDKGPSLEKKQIHHNGGSSNKWSPPPDNEMLQFLMRLDGWKSIPLEIANKYCEDDRYQKLDRNCWNGDSLGDYTHEIMDMHSQKYNPEVPMESSTSDNNSELHKINDQLITMKNIVNKQMTHLSRSDNDKMFSDQAENGSADDEFRQQYDDTYDEDEFSGEGSGISTDSTHHKPEIDIGPSIPVNVPKALDPNSGSSLRISFMLSTFVVVLLSTYVVILFKF